ncbi:hypothetical protein E4U25_003708 [Claviceps purpurea]|nr:hypothetical protein E4U25_003708 [Claviceps purpurea]
MASAKVHLSLFNHPPSGKLAKPRGRNGVKPILKKLHSHSDRGSSLDLDRGWDDQPSPGFAAGSDFGTYDSDGSYHYAAPVAGYAGGYGGGFAGGAVDGARGKYSHVRSTSGNSHASSIATSKSGRNGGTFVHPFQQTPHVSTPPLLYANSRASFENGIATGYSPTITEHDDDDDDDSVDPYASFRSTHSTSTNPRPPLYQSSYRRPSAISHRTSSLSDGNHQTTRISATRCTSAQARGLGAASVNQSRSEVNSSNLSSLAADSPLSASTIPLGTAATTLTTTLSTLSTVQTNVTSSSATPMSPLRNSLDMGVFRLRSRSEVDISTHQEQVLEARRKFEAKERAKEEKYAREQSRKRERAQSKEIHRIEKTQSRLRKECTTTDSAADIALSSGNDIREVPSSSWRTEDSLSGAREKVDPGTHGQPASSARSDDVRYASSKREKTIQTAKTAKQKTAGVWTAFVLWLRTRLLKLGRR